MSDQDAPRKLAAPPPRDNVASAVESCELMIEEGIEKLNAMRAGDAGRRDEVLTYQEGYDEGYQQGRKDAARVVLIDLRGHEHITSVDVRRGDA